MKEFEQQLTKAFLPGLRNDWRSPRNSPGLTQCLNARPSPVGTLHYPGTFTSPIVDPRSSLDWPFPVVFRGTEKLYLCARHYLYSVDPTTFALTPLTAWFSAAENWDFADFHNYVVFINGNLAILIDVTSGDYYFDATFPSAKCMLNFRGQIVLGNTSAGTNWLQWSKIGEQDFTPSNDNEAGNRPVGWSGNILRLLYLGALSSDRQRMLANVVVYGDHGISLLSTHSEPVVTFGELVNNTAFGIPSFGAVAGHEREHVFVDNRGFICRMTLQGIERLGYKEFFQPLLADDIRISYDNIEDQYFLSTEEQCFVLNKYGLGELSQIFTSGWNHNGEFQVTSTTPTSLTIELVSDTIDFGQRAIKLLSMLSVGADTDGQIKACVQFRNDPSLAFYSSLLIPVSPRGLCAPMVSGVDFRIRLQVTNFTRFQLDEVIVRWKLVDKTGIRGAYATGSTATANN